MQPITETKRSLLHRERGASETGGTGRPSPDELRRAFVAELLGRSSQLEQALLLEQDPDERLRLANARRDVAGELRYIQKLIRGHQAPPPEPYQSLLQKVTKALASRSSSLRAWCVEHRTSRSRVSMALRGEPGAGEIHRSMAHLLLVELGIGELVTPKRRANSTVPLARSARRAARSRTSTRNAPCGR